MTMKGDELTVEFRNLLNKAAGRQGLTQASFVVERPLEQADGRFACYIGPASTPARSDPAPSRSRLADQAGNRPLGAVRSSSPGLFYLRNAGRWTAYLGNAG